MIALIGNPNTGKTALFNALTGSRQKVANYPGVTVERKTGELLINNIKTSLLDLPGTYSLSAQTPDEKITTLVLEGKLENKPELLIAVVDATHLARTLALVIELRQLNIPMIVALNMSDLAKKKGLILNTVILEKELGVPVVETAATKKWGVKNLLDRIHQIYLTDTDQKNSDQPLSEALKKASQSIQARFQFVDALIDKATTLNPQLTSRSYTDLIDRIVLHPVAGLLLWIVTLIIVFQSIFTWAEIPMNWLDQFFNGVAELTRRTLPAGPLTDLVVEGGIAGVGSILVFLPQILLLFFFIILLEDSGYMARAAFLMDRLMSKIGLHGRAFIPLLSSHACAIPGIMATRTIENPRDRLITILVSPLTTCSARLPVYALLISAFIPPIKIAGIFNLQGLVLFGLYMAGIFSAFGMAFIFKKTLFKSHRPYLLLEMPSYKWPSPRTIFIALLGRAQIFIKRAGTLILSISIILWFLSHYPKPPLTATEQPITYSFAGIFGKAVEPLVRPLGFDWRIATSLVPGFAAREVMVSALSTVFSVENSNTAILATHLKTVWPLATGLSLMAWYIYAPQCLATLVVVRRETDSWKWPGLLFFYMLFLAYAASFIVYHLAKGWGH